MENNIEIITGRPIHTIPDAISQGYEVLGTKEILEERLNALNEGNLSSEFVNTRKRGFVTGDFFFAYNKSGEVLQGYSQDTIGLSKVLAEISKKAEFTDGETSWKDICKYNLIKVDEDLSGFMDYTKSVILKEEGVISPLEYWCDNLDTKKVFSKNLTLLKNNLDKTVSKSKTGVVEFPFFMKDLCKKDPGFYIRAASFKPLSYGFVIDNFEGDFSYANEYARIAVRKG